MSEAILEAATYLCWLGFTVSGVVNSVYGYRYVHYREMEELGVKQFLDQPRKKQKDYLVRGVIECENPLKMRITQDNLKSVKSPYIVYSRFTTQNYSEGNVAEPRLSDTKFVLARQRDFHLKEHQSHLPVQLTEATDFLALSVYSETTKLSDFWSLLNAIICWLLLIPPSPEVIQRYAICRQLEEVVHVGASVCVAGTLLAPSNALLAKCVAFSKEKIVDKVRVPFVHRAFRDARTLRSTGAAVRVGTKENKTEAKRQTAQYGLETSPGGKGVRYLPILPQRCDI